MARRAKQQDARGIRLLRQVRAPDRQQETGDQSWLTLVARADRTGQAARQYCRFFGRVLFGRLARLGKRLGRWLGRIARACGKWGLYVLFALVMDAVMTLDVLLAHSMRSLRRLCATLRHSTDWHAVQIDGRWMQARRMPGSAALEIRVRKEAP